VSLLADIAAVAGAAASLIGAVTLLLRLLVRISVEPYTERIAEVTKKNDELQKANEALVKQRDEAIELGRDNARINEKALDIIAQQNRRSRVWTKGSAT
jgi:hypothetical protein